MIKTTEQRIRRKRIYLDEATRMNLQNLSYERQQRGLTVKSAAEQLNISRKTLWNYENGKCIPSLSVYIRMSEYFGWEMDSNPNCIFYRLVCCGQLKQWLKKRIRQYSYTIPELSKHLNISSDTVDNLLYRKTHDSPCTFGRLYELFIEEARREEFRNELLTPKRRRANEQGIKCV